jgi:hypothetical protein
MLRGAILLSATVLLAAGAATTARALFQQTPEDWVCREFCRTPQQAAQVRLLENAFRGGCTPECARMCAARDQLQEITLRSRAVTSELRNALEEANRARGASYLALLEHVYAVAAVLPEDRRSDYLRAVLPSVAGCCSSH